MGALEIVSMIAGLANLANKVATENREATADEVKAAIEGARAAISDLDASIAAREAREG